MKKTIKGSRGILVIAFLAFLLPVLFIEYKDQPARVAGFEWNCDQRPCRVEFTLENLGRKPLNVKVEIRGYNFSSDLEMPRPRILVGKREFTESLPAGQSSHYQEEIKFTRYPDELDIKVVDARPSG